MSSEIIAAIVGALLGAGITAFGGWVQSWRQEKADRKALRLGLEIEFAESKDILISTTYLLVSHLGNTDRIFLKWVCDQTEKPDGGRPVPKAYESVRKLLQLSDDQLKLLATQAKAGPAEAKSLKQLELPFLTAQLGRLYLLSIEEQRRALVIRDRIRIINQEIERSRFYYETTYVPGMAPENMELLQKNILGSYDQIAIVSRQAVELITEFFR